ncbi:hypothetical protein OSTOST_01127 [Ostertagia ostertagi]
MLDARIQTPTLYRGNTSPKNWTRYETSRRIQQRLKTPLQTADNTRTECPVHYGSTCLRKAGLLRTPTNLREASFDYEVEAHTFTEQTNYPLTRVTANCARFTRKAAKGKQLALEVSMLVAATLNYVHQRNLEDSFTAAYQIHITKPHAQFSQRPGETEAEHSDTLKTYLEEESSRKWTPSRTASLPSSFLTDTTAAKGGRTCHNTSSGEMYSRFYKQETIPSIFVLPGTFRYQCKLSYFKPTDTEAHSRIAELSNSLYVDNVPLDDKKQTN